MTPTKRSAQRVRDAITILIILEIVGIVIWLCIDQIHILER